MNSTIQLSLKPDLIESLTEIADEQGVTVERVVDDLVRHFLHQARWQKIEQENTHFVALHPQLKRDYYHQHVAILEGKLVDHDGDLDVLAGRVREKFGRLPVLIAFVDDEPSPTFKIRRPQLQFSR